jgi:hypothetical protein
MHLLEFGLQLETAQFSQHLHALYLGNAKHHQRNTLSNKET